MHPHRRELLRVIRDYAPLVVVFAIAAVLWVVLVEPSELSEPPAPPRPSREQAEPERELTLAERFELPTNPTHVEVLGAKDIQVMPAREVTIDGDTTPYALGSLPKAQKLLTGKNLWLAGPFPIATDRVFLNVTSEASEFSPPLRSLLVDLHSGAVLGTYDGVYGQYRTFGVAWGSEKDPSTGRTRRVLIHARDGLAVPVEDYGADPERRILLFNAAFGFAVIIQPDDPTSNDGTSHYAVWHDLRSPPPPLTEVLPFIPLPSRPTVDDVLTEGPTAFYPYLGPTLVWGEDAPENCKRASFWPGESRHRCHHRHIPLTHEWSIIEPYLDRPLAVYHHFTDTLHVLEPCTFRPDYDVGNREQLSIVFGCVDQGRMLWTPAGLFKKGGNVSAGSTHEWNRNRTIRAKIEQSSETGTDTEWIDTVAVRWFAFRYPYHEPLTSFVKKTRVPTIPYDDPLNLWALDLETQDRVIRPRARTCRDIDYESHDGDWWAYSCRGRRRENLWMEIAHLGYGHRYGLRAAKDIHIDAEAGHLLVVQRASSEDVVHRISLPVNR